MGWDLAVQRWSAGFVTPRLLLRPPLHVLHHLRLPAISGRLSNVVSFKTGPALLVAARARRLLGDGAPRRIHSLMRFVDTAPAQGSSYQIRAVNAAGTSGFSVAVAG
jgi:hypothetical protein